MPIEQEFKPGQVLGAVEMNDIKAEIRRLGKVSAEAPLYVQDNASGFRFDLDQRGTFPIKLTSGGTGGKYAWTGQDFAAGGTWANNASSGTTSVDPAYEVNGNASITTPTIVMRAYRDRQTNLVHFERATC